MSTTLDRVSEAAKTVAKAVAKSKAKTEKPTSALAAAAKVLADADAPMSTKALVDAMSAKGLWKSPEGKTPDRTLYSAIAREITKKRKASRFKGAEKRKIALRDARG